MGFTIVFRKDTMDSIEFIVNKTCMNKFKTHRRIRTEKDSPVFFI